MSSVVSRGRVHYAWVVAGVTFVVLAMAAGFRSVPGVLFIPLGKDFGWSHALIGGAVSVNLVVYGLGAPFAAAIVERFGVRKVTTFALCQVAVGAGLSVFMTQPWQLYLLWGVVIGSATGNSTRFTSAPSSMAGLYAFSGNQMVSGRPIRTLSWCRVKGSARNSASHSPCGLRCTT